LNIAILQSLYCFLTGKLLVNPRRGVVGPNEEVSVRVTMPPLKPLEKRTAYDIQVNSIDNVDCLNISLN
jgi:hypothetical protein